MEAETTTTFFSMVEILMLRHRGPVFRATIEKSRSSAFWVAGITQYFSEEEEQVFIGKQKDDLDGAAVPTPYLQQYFYTNTTTQMWAL